MQSKSSFGMFDHLVNDSFRMTNLGHYGDVIRTCRFRNNMTQAEFGERLDYNASFIGAVENNKVVMPQAMIEALCEAFPELIHRKAWFEAARFQRLKKMPTELMDTDEVEQFFQRAKEIRGYADFKNKRADIIGYQKPRFTMRAQLGNKAA